MGQSVAYTLSDSDYDISAVRERFQTSVDELFKMYGVVNNPSDTSKHLNHIVSDLVTAVANKVKDGGLKVRCHDGSIHHGDVAECTNIAYEVLNEIDRRGIVINDLDNHRDIMLGSDRLYSFCEETNNIYNSIGPLISKYLMRHNCIPELFDLVSLGNTPDIKFKGLISETIDELVNKGDKIRIKARVLADSGELQWWNQLFAVELLNKIYEKDYTRNYERARYDRLQIKCRVHDISFCDAIVRFCRGNLSIEDIIAEGLRDKELYGYEFDSPEAIVQVERCGVKINVCMSTINRIKYLEYKAREEQAVEK